MKRGGRLQRRTRLAPGKGPERRTELRHGDSPLRRSKPSSRKSRSKAPNPNPDISDLRERVFERAGGRCDLCGLPLHWSVWECHHRQKRSQGGRDSMANLIALHSRCHSDRVHGRPAWSYESGFMVRRNGEPTTEPLMRHEKRWQLPGETQWIDAQPPARAEVA